MKKGIKEPRQDVRKNITMTKEQFIILSEEAKELCYGNFSMHIKNILDQYIRHRDVVQGSSYN